MTDYNEEHVKRLLHEWAAAERRACTRGPGPALLKRLDSEMAAIQLNQEIRRIFPWVAAAALAAAVILAWINLNTLEQLNQHPLEAIFALPQSNLEDSLLVNL